jgi:hypothetical protein
MRGARGCGVVQGRVNEIVVKIGNEARAWLRVGMASIAPQKGAAVSLLRGGIGTCLLACEEGN